MRMYDVIRKKRDGGTLNKEEIYAFIRGYVAGEIPDYQASALLMAIYFRGMTDEETANLTFAMRDSGDKLDLSHLGGVRVDKHSTGGVGDKTSLIAMPVVASCGVTVAKMSGRGLGHTGGTVDKLEAFPGFRTDLSSAEFESAVKEAGIAIVGQSGTLAPADKLLYALRDVTATVDSIPLIASSIMSKKLAADDHCIVLDVKTGSGAFMKTVEESTLLAKTMVEIGKRAGKKMRALITDMDIPLGNAVGNALEVQEAISVLSGNGPADLTEVSLALAAHMLCLAGKGTLSACEEMAKNAIASGAALKTLAKMVKMQGGDERLVSQPQLFAKAQCSYAVCARESGYITAVNAESYGTASLLLGAGRNKKEDAIDLSAGIMLCKKTGDSVKKGEVIARLYAAREELFPAAENVLLAATKIGGEPPKKRPLILAVVE